MTRAIGNCYLVEINGRKELCSLREIDKVKNQAILECVTGSINAGRTVKVSRDALRENLSLGVFKFPGTVVEDENRIYVKAQEETFEM